MSDELRIPDLGELSGLVQDIGVKVVKATTPDGELDVAAMLAVAQVDIALAMAIDTRRLADAAELQVRVTERFTRAAELLARAIERQSGTHGHKVVVRDR